MQKRRLRVHKLRIRVVGQRDRQNTFLITNDVEVNKPLFAATSTFHGHARQSRRSRSPAFDMCFQIRAIVRRVHVNREFNTTVRG